MTKFATIFSAGMILAATTLAPTSSYSDHRQTDDEGVIWTWGDNFFGELGHKKGVQWPFGSSYGPTVVTDIAAATEVAAGFYHTISLDDQGFVWTWGSNDNGELGIGKTSHSAPPSRVPNLNDGSALAAGQFFSLIVLKDGSLCACGSNHAGQLGDGTTQDRNEPVRVNGIGDVRLVAAGRDFALALKHDASIWAWGGNGHGQLGDGSKTSRSTPTKIAALNDVASIACGSHTAIAQTKDGTVWAWGYNWYGNVGDGTETDRSVPMQVIGLEKVMAIACGANHTLALEKDGTVWVWGYGLKGELGLGKGKIRNSGPKTNRAVQIPDLHHIKAIAAGWDHSAAVDKDGGVWAWGRNWHGQFGVAEPRDSLVPVKVMTFPGIQRIVCGVDHTVVIAATGSKPTTATHEP